MHSWGELKFGALAALVGLAAVALVVGRVQPAGSSASVAGTVSKASVATPTATAAPTVPPSPATKALVDKGTIGAATVLKPAGVRQTPSFSAHYLSRVRPGILLPVLAQKGSWLQVMTPCQVTGWVHSDKMRTHARAQGKPGSLKEATIVLDPGHGGKQPGAVGPDGLTEKAANLDIAQRLARQLDGTRVFLTRTSDITAGLSYRTALANRLGAHLFASIHNNAVPDGLSKKPGTETYYQVRSEASKRLAGLTYEELLRALERFDVTWASDKDAGAKFRINTKHEDYYAVLRRSYVPAVLIEAMFISNGAEEKLLWKDDVRDLVAAALVKGFDRYFTTDDPGSGFVKKPLARGPAPSGHLPQICIDPA